MKISRLISIIIIAPIFLFGLLYVGMLKIIEYITEPIVRWDRIRTLEKQLGRKLTAEEKA